MTATTDHIATASAEAKDPGDVVLSVTDLSVSFPTDEGLVKAVSDLSYEARLGRTLAIVGESGSGKSVSSMAVLGLHNMKRTKITGSIKLDGTELVGAPQTTFQEIRSTKAAMVFQDPQSSLHPFTGRRPDRRGLPRPPQGQQERGAQASGRDARPGRHPEPQRRASQYPHEFSGGMRQRAMIALGLVNNPKLLIADEPTTALDVTVQAQILDLVNDLQKEFGSAVILITHDLAVVAETADDIIVMYAGRGVERATPRRCWPSRRTPTPTACSSRCRRTRMTSTRLRAIKGAPPSLLSLPPGCSFHPRCTFKDQVEGDACWTVLPEFRPTPGLASRQLRCHLVDPVATLQNDEGVR